MYAAIEASRHDADVLLLDKSLVGRGGATVMAQMTVAAAIGHAEPDDWRLHLQDTMKSGKGLNDGSLASLLCSEGPERILETRQMGVRWAADGDLLRQVDAPGHSRRRCCYIGSLGTGIGVSNGLQRGGWSPPSPMASSWPATLCTPSLLCEVRAAILTTSTPNSTGPSTVASPLSTRSSAT